MSVAQRDDTSGEEGELSLRRARVHVDHAGVGVGLDREEELAEAVDDLGLAVLVLQLAGELGGPLRQVLDLRQVVEDGVLRRVEDSGDSPADQASSLVWYTD